MPQCRSIQSPQPCTARLRGLPAQAAAVVSYSKDSPSSSRPFMVRRRCYCLPPPLSAKTARAAVWLGHVCKGRGGVRSFRSPLPGGSLSGPEPPPRERARLLRRGPRTVVRDAARGRAGVSPRQAPRSQLSARADAGGDRRAGARPEVVGLLGDGALVAALAGAARSHAHPEAGGGGVHAAQR